MGIAAMGGADAIPISGSGADPWWASPVSEEG